VVAEPDSLGAAKSQASPGYRPDEAGQYSARLPLFERDTFGLVEPIGEGENERELLQF
jgi:hypothetical protein